MSHRRRKKRNNCNPELEKIKNQYGYLFQNTNKYFCHFGATTIFNSGFKSLEQFESWIAEEFLKHGLDWRVGYSWKYKDNDKIFMLVNMFGKEIKQK